MARFRSRMRLKVDGANDIIKALEQADKDLTRELKVLISEAAEIVFREADARVPIKSGASRESLRIEVGTNKRGEYFANVNVGDEQNTYYITFYELGTSRQPPRPFMRPSLDKSRRKVRQHLIEGLRKAIARQGR